jgi:hypothetical protein
MLQEPGSYVGEVVKVMGKKKVLVKVRLFEGGDGAQSHRTRVVLRLEEIWRLTGRFRLDAGASGG